MNERKQGAKQALSSVGRACAMIFDDMKHSIFVTRFWVFLTLFLGGQLAAMAQSTFCVRQGATGANNGSDWNNAYTSLPATLVRGATYYVAAGSYGAYVFDDVESGSTLITIKKATVTEHGTNTGWNDSYAGAATWGNLVFARDYYVFDGAYRNESQWNQPNSYGFRVTGTVYSWPVNYPPGGDQITIRYCDIGGAYSDSWAAGLNTGVYVVGNQNNLTVSRCYIHNVKVGLLYNGLDTYTVEECFIGPGWGKEALRGGAVCRNGIIRHNTFYNSTQTDPSDGTSGITAEIGIWGSTDATAYANIAVYGNVFHSTKFGGRNAVVVIGGNGGSWYGAAASGALVYNNTFVDVSETAVFGMVLINGTGEAKNNLFYNCASTNMYASATAGNKVVSVDPFVNRLGLDWRITSTSQACNAGVALGAPYSSDRLGATRGADGSWDVGAYEYITSGPISPTIITQPSSVSVSVGNSAAFTVAASGTAPLSYQWQRNGDDLAEANTASYTIPATTLSDSGATFRVIVSNSAGSTTSQVATLTVTTTPNLAPTVSLTSPTNNATFTAPASITLTATAADSDGSIAKVEFFNGSTKLGEDMTNPFSFSWSNITAGSYSLTARATDNLGATATSSAITVTATTPTTNAFSIGERVMVNSDPTLRVRSSAALAGAVIGEQSFQATGTIVGGPVTADGYTWWQIDYDTDPDGWSIQGDGSASWLVLATGAPPPPPTGLIIQ